MSWWQRLWDAMTDDRSWYDREDDRRARAGITFAEENRMRVAQDAKDHGMTLEEWDRHCSRRSAEMLAEERERVRQRRERDRELWPKDKPFRS